METEELSLHYKYSYSSHLHKKMYQFWSVDKNNVVCKKIFVPCFSSYYVNQIIGSISEAVFHNIIIINSHCL